MRTINELLQLGLDNFDEYFVTGLCSIFPRLCSHNKITLEECDEIRNYLKLNLPPRFHGYGFSWQQKVKEPRIAWLKEHIELTKLDASQ